MRNFFFEQARWWTLYAWGAAAADVLLNASIAGAARLTLLFIGSTVITESISAKKYSGYAGYRRTTSMLVPLPPRSAGQAVPSLSPDSRR